MNIIPTPLRFFGLTVSGLLRYISHVLTPPRPKKGADLPPGSSAEARKSVKDLLRHECVGCGLCLSVCPVKAITMSRDEWGPLPEVADTCTECGLCLRGCPGINRIKYEAPLGTIKSLHVGHAADPSVRYEASSGGACRAILRALLEQKLVDAVIISRITDDPLTPETIITDSLDDLRGDRINSIYSPASPLTVLKDLDKTKKYAFVGLPCQIAGLSLVPRFRKLIPYTIGILCSHTPGYPFVKKFMRDMAPGGTIRRVRYRGEGWPGKSRLDFANGKSRPVPFPAMWHTYNFDKRYQQPRCRSCGYYSAEQADISLGDPWILAKKDHQGSSLIFVRTEKGEEAMKAVGPLMELRQPEGEELEAILAFHKNSAALKRAHDPELQG